MKKPITSNILGVDIAITNMTDALNLILEQLEELRGEYICFSNAHTTVMAYEDENYRIAQNSSFLALPDGSPLSYVQRLKGHGEARRVAGPDFMTEFWKASSGRNISHYFYGSSPNTIAKLKACLEQKYPGVKIAGMESPPFRVLTAEEDEETVQRINASGASIVWVGLGAPKQETWMLAHKGKIHALMLGVGAGFDFHAGVAKRAPMWMQTHYLEWMFRLINDPKRLWKRYVITNGKFVGFLCREAWMSSKDGWGRTKKKQRRAETTRKKLLVYAHYYYPDVASTGQILTELCEGLKKQFQITVICTVPSYVGHVDAHYRTHKYYYEDINGIQVLRVRVPEFRKNFPVSRVYNILQYFISAMIATIKVGEADYVFALSQPPILGGLLGVYGKWIKQAKLIYNIQDFNPEQVIAVRYTASRLVTSVMMFWDKWTCKHADKVILVGRDQVETLMYRFRNEIKKLPPYTVINNWINEKQVYPLSEDDWELCELKRQYGLTGKKIMMYSGNIGLYYDLLKILEIIGEYRYREDWAFVFAGQGSVLESLKKYAVENHLRNVYFLPYQEKRKLNASLNLADVHLVVNAKGIKGVSVPSKLYGVMAAGKSVLGILEAGSEARCIVEEVGCGRCVEPGDYEAIRNLIDWYLEEKISRDARQLMGSAGRSYLEKHLTKDISIERYREEIEKL